jgi:hypothetical protein
MTVLLSPHRGWLAAREVTHGVLRGLRSFAALRLAF